MTDRMSSAADEIWKPRPRVDFIRQADLPKTRWINLSHLLSHYDEAKRRRLWDRIKQRSPALALLLQDKLLWDLARTFSAQVYVEDLREAPSGA